ncbi:MAG: hypothetical protein K8S13_13750, partial [Desulfobacula sp.]|uniref:hypothetical protein n=1 Tax=Desulfobacula sp. TaxID=2593537 RepID=UPI0025BC0553
KPASAVFKRGHYLKEEKPNPGSLPAIMAKITLKGKCHVTPQSQRLRPPGSYAAWDKKGVEKGCRLFQA